MRSLIVDGYNVIHAWPALKRVLRQRGVEDARRRLVQLLAEYAAQTGTQVTAVFDSHGRVESGEPVDVVDGVNVRYGTRTATADNVIERLAGDAARRGAAADAVVATSDRLQREVVGAMGVATMSAGALELELARVAAGVSEAARQQRSVAGTARRVEHRLDADTRRRLEDIRRGRVTTDADAADP